MFRGCSAALQETVLNEALHLSISSATADHSSRIAGIWGLDVGSATVHQHIGVHSSPLQHSIELPGMLEELRTFLWFHSSF